MLHYFKYPGVKKYFIKLFNEITSDLKVDNYYELFAGSGILHMNSQVKFTNVLLNDINKYVIRIHKSFRDGSWDQYMSCVDMARSIGDLKDKAGYTNFRTFYNRNWFDTDTIEEGFYIHILLGSCLQSLMRFSKNGFNQTFGKREKIINAHDFYSVKERLVNVLLISGDFFDIKIADNSLVFLDPPYTSTFNDLYDNIWNIDKFNKLCGLMKDMDERGNYFIYTDVLHDINFDLPYRREVIDRNFLTNRPYNVDPDRQRLTEKVECYWTNIPNNTMF